MTAAHSTAGRAYVIRNELVGSSYWNCYANNGDPVCYQVTKVDKDTPIAALDSQPNGAHVTKAPEKQAEPVAAETKAEPAAAPATEKKKAAGKDAKKPTASNTTSTRKPLTASEN